MEQCLVRGLLAGWLVKPLRLIRLFPVTGAPPNILDSQRHGLYRGRVNGGSILPVAQVCVTRDESFCHPGAYTHPSGY